MVVFSNYYKSSVLFLQVCHGSLILFRLPSYLYYNFKNKFTITIVRTTFLSMSHCTFKTAILFHHPNPRCFICNTLFNRYIVSKNRQNAVFNYRWFWKHLLSLARMHNQIRFQFYYLKKSKSNGYLVSKKI